MVEGVWCANDCAWPYESDGSPHLDDFRPDWAYGEMDPIDGQGEAAPPALFGVAAHSDQSNRLLGFEHGSGNLHVRFILNLSRPTAGSLSIELFEEVPIAQKMPNRI